MNEIKPIKSLPNDDSEFWEGAESYKEERKEIPFCLTHTKDNWLDHVGYRQEADGSVTCKFCPWGTRMPGYYRVQNGRVIDLRTISSQ